MIDNDKSEFVINALGISKSFNDHKVLDNITIKVPRGKVYGFLGPNGSGKTTTIRIICGLLTPDTGSGTCLGYDIRKQSEKIKEKIGYMTQKFSYWEDLTVIENISFVADIFSLENKNQSVINAIQKFGLEIHQNTLAGNLSGGWKQRLALAACTLHNPQLLFLDEPTAGVDPQSRRDFWDEIHKLADDGITVLVSTHYMDEAERCHKIIYIAGGRIITEGTIEEVIKNSKLITWVVKGSNLLNLKEKIQKNFSNMIVATFGASLHVSGFDKKNLEKIVAHYNIGYDWAQIEPSMEDAFIHYMRQAKWGTDCE